MTTTLILLSSRYSIFSRSLTAFRLKIGQRVDLDFNLLEAGFVDSIGFVDLLNHLQEVTQVMVDVSEVDLAELATLRGLKRHYGQTCGSSAG